MALVLVVASLWLLIQLWPVLLVVVVALLVAGTLSPAIRWLEEKRVGRGFGIAIVFTVFFILALLVVVLTIPTLVSQAAALLKNEPALRARLADHLAGSPVSAPLATWLRGLKADALTHAISATAFAFSIRVFDVVAYGLSALFLGLYIIIDRDRLRGWLFALVPRSHHIRLSRIMINLETIVGAYIRGQMVTCLLMALFVFGLLKVCGVENALALAAFAGLADVLPYIGPLLSVGPAVLAALSRGPVVTIVVLVLMLAYEEFESRVLVPRIYGRALRLPSSVVLFALLAGGTLMGILGALLALPVAAAVMMLIEELRVGLPGEQEQLVDTLLREADDRGEEEYERRTAGVGAEQAAAIATEISRDRREEENHPPEAAGTTIENGNANGDERSTTPADNTEGNQ
ncbi:AI-2E family transporter [Candidatus Deferrimicrobium sp.]|uniref:AI-2E family transporter n=1 Tax=Candidatus Deferrimicrobium sp. TaxID=3060586 RepID=UPI0027201D0E|nr:AI-2E family transporter [Candidatus Deferrimicrobium sp.]MDO8738710.1 AI-2E family transporter [Candidatus Deferrimicrobium sp.]